MSRGRLQLGERVRIYGPTCYDPTTDGTLVSMERRAGSAWVLTDGQLMTKVHLTRLGRVR